MKLRTGHRPQLKPLPLSNVSIGRKGLPKPSFLRDFLPDRMARVMLKRHFPSPRSLASTVVMDRYSLYVLS